MPKNNDFNFEQFAVSAINFIDSIRSFTRVGNSPVESRINAFYRALGLPAVIKEDPNEEDDESGNAKIPSVNVPDEFNNGNIFNAKDLSYKSYENKFLSRQSNFVTPIDKQEINEFLDTNPNSLDSSIQENGRKRGVLLPAMVDGEIHVFPQNRRIAGAFQTYAQRKHSKNVYTRPLIETIILIKLKGDNVVDSEKQSRLSLSLDSEALEKINDDVLLTLGNTVNNIGELLEKAAKASGALRQKTGIKVIPTIAHVAQQNPVIEQPETDASRGKLDIRKINLENKNNIKQTKIALFEFDDIISGIDSSDSRSLRDSALASQVLSILTPLETSSVTKRGLKKINEQIAKANTEAKELSRILELLYGTFGGISGVDILAVIVAMFNMSSEDLVGLLNEESKSGLAELKGENLTAIRQASSVSAAIVSLEFEIARVFSNITASIGTRKQREKQENQGE